MAITIATMGRLMKNFDIAGHLAPDAGTADAVAPDARACGGLVSTCIPWPDLLDALDDDPLAGVDTVTDNPLSANCLAKLHGSHCGSEIVTSDPEEAARKVRLLGSDFGVDARIAYDGLSVTL